ncbi:MAG: carboxylating nicotinate-nucleotide diphosphorylase, partial [Promethearchaeota archaeon]
SIRDFIAETIRGDVGYGDVTSKLVDNKKADAIIIAKSDGVICGILEAITAFQIMGVNVIKSVKDGYHAEKNAIIMKLTGYLWNILAAERTALNFLMKMSSIATSTNNLVNRFRREYPSLRIAATRKTTPGFRMFEKRAVIIGGGDPHRWRLDDMVLIKDTHIDAARLEGVGLLEFIKSSKSKSSFSKKIEVEVESIEDALIAFKAGADIIMLDNMDPNTIKMTLKKIKKALKENIGKINRTMPLIEASGNISHGNIEAYVKTGVDIISSSELTLSPKDRVDLSLKIKKIYA